MKIGFVGLGVQGKYLAINLAEAGHDVLVYDLRPGPLGEVVATGARAAASNHEIGAHGEVNCVCVLDDNQLRSVVLGERGLLAGAASGSLIVVHSTVSPGVIDELAVQARARGVELVDAPVSGSEPGARNKTMSFMVGASPEAFERCQPVFAVSGKNIRHTGALGTGIRAKLAHQLIICVNMLAAQEGMRLGVAAGLSPEVLEQVIHNGGAQSRIADLWFKRKLGPHARQVFYKDLQLCLAFAHELGIPVPGAALAQQLLDQIVP